MRKILRHEYLQHFMSKVEKLGNESGCWIWIAGMTNRHYGSAGFGGVHARAHCASYELHFGPIPEGMRVCHHCDTPLCVRPDHLWLGTQLQNVADREAKGRTARGEGNGKSLLTEEKVIEIRRLYRDGMNRAELGRMFGHDFKTISAVVLWKSWTHVAACP